MMSKSADKIYKNKVADVQVQLAVVEVSSLPFAHLPAKSEFFSRARRTITERSIALPSFHRQDPFSAATTTASQH
jgi:hypothetical protein